MVGTRYDYLLILVVLVMFIGTAHGEDILAAARKPEFWSAGLVYLICCGVLDYFAIRLRWWTFDASKIAGVTLAEIPLEEFILFGAIYSLTIGAWSRPT